MSFLTKLFGDENKHLLKKYEEIVPEINAFEPTISKLSDEDLRAKTTYFKEELGSGKTAFVKGVADYFGIQNITSPTFTVMKVYKTKKNNTQIKSLIHVDCYRLDDYQSLLDIGLGDYLEEKPVLHSLSEGGSLVLIEWADKIKGSLPKKTKYIKFKLGKNENTRIIII